MMGPALNSSRGQASASAGCGRGRHAEARKRYALVAADRRQAGLNLAGTGGARRDRTADLVNAIHALSQLSYGPLFRKSEARSQKSEMAQLDFRHLT